MVELKPCPYCGSPAEMDSSDMADWVRCTGNECGAEGPALESAAASIAAWNRRAPVSAPTAGKRQSIEDDEDFWALVTAWANSRGTVRDHLAKAALIAHIDTWASRSAGDAVPAQTELLAAADAVVERWHSRDWKQPHTAEFVNRLAAAVGAVKFGGAAPARGNTEKPTESQKGENA